MDDNVVDDIMVKGDGADEPLLLDGSTGRPRPRTFTFLEFISIPPGPKTLPWTLRTFAGIFLLFSMFVSIPFFILIYPLAYWLYYRFHGPLVTLQSQVRVSTFLYGAHSRFVAMAWFRLGLYYESQNEPDQALACYKEITDFPVCQHHDGAAPYYSKIGKLLYTLGRYEEALEAFETSLTLRRQLEKALFVLRLQEMLHCIGQTQERLGNLDEAFKVFQEAHTALVQRGHDRCIECAKSLALMARVLASMGKVDESLKKYQEALDIYVYNVGEFPRRKSIAELYKSMGDLRVQKGEDALAAENYGMAVEVFRRGGRSDEDKEMQSIIRKMEDLKAVGAGQRV